ncbi:MAG: response regulator transcription factor [Campylobacterales bacterium]|nr:response regulator transcription factor [Campylobacterales bacterium]
MKDREILKFSKILYAEDEDGIRENIASVLKYYCSNLITAKDGKEALRLYKLNKPDICILDINMPKMSGLEVACEIRKDDNDTRIIIATAHAEKEYLIKAVEQNLTRYLLKPITENALFEALIKSTKEMKKFKHVSFKLSENLSYNYFEKELVKHEEHIKLSKNESKLLELFIEQLNKMVTYEDIETVVYEDDIVTLQAIRSLVKKLRDKMCEDLIANCVGFGYKLSVKENSHE